MKGLADYAAALPTLHFGLIISEKLPVNTLTGDGTMPISRKLGILVFCGVPAIIGGGIVYALFGHSAVAVTVYETILLLGAGAFVSE